MLLISRFAFLCDIRECYLFLDSCFFATYGNVNLHCCEFASLAAVVFLTVCLDASIFASRWGCWCATEWACGAAEGRPHGRPFGATRSGGRGRARPAVGHGLKPDAKHRLPANMKNCCKLSKKRHAGRMFPYVAQHTIFFKTRSLKTGSHAGWMYVFLKRYPQVTTCMK